MSVNRSTAEMLPQKYTEDTQCNKFFGTIKKCVVVHNKISVSQVM